MRDGCRCGGFPAAHRRGLVRRSPRTQGHRADPVRTAQPPARHRYRGAAARTTGVSGRRKTLPDLRRVVPRGVRGAHGARTAGRAGASRADDHGADVLADRHGSPSGCTGRAGPRHSGMDLRRSRWQSRSERRPIPGTGVATTARQLLRPGVDHRDRAAVRTTWWDSARRGQSSRCSWRRSSSTLWARSCCASGDRPTVRAAIRRTPSSRMLASHVSSLSSFS